MTGARVGPISESIKYSIQQEESAIFIGTVNFFTEIRGVYPAQGPAFDRQHHQRLWSICVTYFDLTAGWGKRQLPHSGSPSRRLRLPLVGKGGKGCPDMNFL
jgi:hypothetical protein